MITFAYMLASDRDALECDFAQFYGIYDITRMDPAIIITLACGMPAESRIIRKLSKTQNDIKTLLLATIADSVALLVWFRTKDGQRNRNRPKSFAQILSGKGEKIKQEQSFATPAEFEKRRREILEGAK